MSKIIVFSLFVLFLYACTGQKGMSSGSVSQIEELPVDIDKQKALAKSFFDAGDYYHAGKVYEKINEKVADNDVRFKLAICYFEQKSNLILAEDLFKMAVDSGQNLGYYYMGRISHYNYDFDKAIENYMYFKNGVKYGITNFYVDRYITMAKNAREIYEHPVDVEVVNLGEKVNSEYDEYTPIITSAEDGLYFTSRRPGGTTDDKDYYDKYFEDIYFVPFDNGDIPDVMNVGAPLNTSTHDATVSISPAGNIMIVYRTNENITGGDLYYSYQTIDGWGTPQKLGNQINTKYQEPSAYISSDESVMYFSSNRPGGYGGKDIYMVKKLPDGEWAKPINMGPVINTPYDEDAPFIHADGKTFYFSSNGHETMGGYDIFYTVKGDDDIWSLPKNIGYPINTTGDDLYFSLNPDGSTGYFSSGREGGNGGQDLYKVDMNEHKKDVIIFKGKILDSNNNPVKATITLIDEKEQKVQGIYQSNITNGTYIVLGYPERKYKMIIEAKSFESETNELEWYNEVFDYPVMLDDIVLRNK